VHLLHPFASVSGAGSIRQFDGYPLKFMIIFIGDGDGETLLHPEKRPSCLFVVVVETECRQTGIAQSNQVALAILGCTNDALCNYFMNDRRWFGVRLPAIIIKCLAYNVGDAVAKNDPGLSDKRQNGRPVSSFNEASATMMLDHIDRHSDDPSLSAATLARKFHCSERYVHKLFSKTGRSVCEHVNHKRILVCTRDLLGDSRNRTIAEIAFAAGFRDISHFNRLFKRSNGASPREFRHAMTSSTGRTTAVAP
jgi:AraC-like DNA-binding protein